MKTILLALALLVCAGSAQAGVMNFNNGQGSWQPTRCPRPVPPSAMPANSEAAAAQLNRSGVQFNQYVQAVQNYMQCITEEAKQDAQASSQAVLNSLSQQVQAAQADVDRERAQMFMKK